MAEIILITGEIQSGKTSLCLDLYRKAQEAGLQVGGILSPAVFEEEEKTAIDILDLKSGIRKRLAEIKTQTQTDLETQHWSFFQETVDWGNKMLLEAVPCDLLIVDELGPLEFHRSEGWVNGFAVIESGDYSAALLVIRPSLIEQAFQRWKLSRIIDLSAVGAEVLTGKDLFNTLNLE
jgi:nucleoside-triphosphatase THEP1